MGLRFRLGKGFTVGRSGLRWNNRNFGIGASGTRISGGPFNYWIPGSSGGRRRKASGSGVRGGGTRTRSVRTVLPTCAGILESGAQCSNQATQGLTCRRHVAQAPAIAQMRQAEALAAEQRMQVIKEQEEAQRRYEAENPIYGPEQLRTGGGGLFIVCLALLLLCLVSFFTIGAGGNWFGHSAKAASWKPDLNDGLSVGCNDPLTSCWKGETSTTVTTRVTVDFAAVAAAVPQGSLDIERVEFEPTADGGSVTVTTDIFPPGNGWLYDPNVEFTVSQAARIKLICESVRTIPGVWVVHIKGPYYPNGSMVDRTMEIANSLTGCQTEYVPISDAVGDRRNGVGGELGSSSANSTGTNNYGSGHKRAGCNQYGCWTK